VIVYFGTSLFSARILEFLLEQKIEVAAVVTQPARPKGRSKRPVSTPVAELAAKKGLDCHPFPKASASEALEILSKYQADLFVVAAYGQILKQVLLDLPSKGCINVHPSLLPKYRGAAPIQRCMMAGESETGVTIMEVVQKLDAGDIILQEKVSIGPDTLFPELEEELCELSCKLLLQAIQNIDTLSHTPQDEELVTYADKIEPEDGRLNWHHLADELHNLVRALTPKPGAWCLIEINGQEKRLKILHSKISNDSFQLLEVQLAGKRAMSYEEFLRGLQGKTFLFL